MLKLRNLTENFTLVKEVLQKYWDYDEEGLDEMLGYYRISSNGIYPYYYEKNVRFLRIAPVDEKLEKNLYGEIAFIKNLNQNNYPALKPITSKTGESAVLTNTPWGKYYVTSFEAVSGIQISKTNMSAEVMYAYGKALGKLHTLSSEYTPTIKKWDYNEVLDWIDTVLIEYKAPQFVHTELASIKDLLAKLPANTLSYGLVHYDFEFDNVFYDEGTHSCSVIDFDDGMYHWYALDIVQVLDCIEEELDSGKWEMAKDEFINGYRSEHLLSKEMVDSYPLMRRFTNLYGYARLIRCVAETFDAEPDWMSELRIELNTVIRDKESKMK
ncbi:phosphotransferase enzyme family protein [Scatolibacter rhodanostii]|uniref:phosphotransferase enzyme family protein n=1 Tax=Scatolibacter rhodanostii TaxID=2014781 RepID=UPI000C07477E|nr:phosphotransferase [Scatolibacter rhodanostii]